jgi:hypothetical protein
MRLLFAVLFLITPLRGVAAAALCVVGEHGHEEACEPGMGGESGHDMAPGAGFPAGLAQMAGTHLGSGPDMPIGCGALGLCSTTIPSIAGHIVDIPSVTLADAHPVSFARLLRPGTRPAPPIHPPRA